MRLLVVYAFLAETLFFVKIPPFVVQSSEFVALLPYDDSGLGCLTQVCV